MVRHIIPTRRELDSIEEEGREAAIAGKDWKDCPYGTIARRSAWILGWETAVRNGKANPEGRIA